MLARGYEADPPPGAQHSLVLRVRPAACEPPGAAPMPAVELRPEAAPIGPAASKLAPDHRQVPVVATSPVVGARPPAIDRPCRPHPAFSSPGAPSGQKDPAYYCPVPIKSSSKPSSSRSNTACTDSRGNREIRLCQPWQCPSTDVPLVRAIRTAGLEARAPEIHRVGWSIRKWSSVPKSLHWEMSASSYRSPRSCVKLCVHAGRLATGRPQPPRRPFARVHAASTTMAQWRW